MCPPVCSVVALDWLWLPFLLPSVYIGSFHNPKSFFQTLVPRPADSSLDASAITHTAAFLEGTEMSVDSARFESGLHSKAELCDLGQST